MSSTSRRIIGSGTAYDLAPDRVAAFERDGFVHLPGVLDPDVVRRYEPEITEQVIELNTMHLPMAERSTYDKAFLQVGNLWKRSDQVRELVFSRRLARLAADLLGVEGVRLHHDQALYKEPGGGITPWHADQYYWPLSSDRCGTIWLPLQETPLEMGPLSFAADPRRVMTIIYIDADMLAAEPVTTTRRATSRRRCRGSRRARWRPARRTRCCTGAEARARRRWRGWVPAALQ